MPRPAPPWLSGTSSPGKPSAVNASHSFSSKPAPASACFLSCSMGRRVASMPLTDCASMRCSSVRSNSTGSLPPRLRRHVRLGLTRQAEAPLADDVFLNVGGASADDQADIVHVVDLPGRGFIIFAGLPVQL